MLWESYRYFLAVAETGSLSAAARRLSVSQPTVGRQIADLEARLNTRLFDRASHGYHLTAAGETIQAHITEIDAGFAEVETLVSGLDLALSGEVSISATEGLGSGWLVEVLKSFQREHPAISFNLLLDVSVVDLRRGKADIALRLGNPVDPELIGRKVGEIGFGLYGAKSYFENKAAPKSLADLASHDFVKWRHQMTHFEFADYIDDISAKGRVVLRSDTVAAQVKAVEESMGLFVAPHYMISRNRRVQRVLTDEINPVIDFWLLTHKGLRQNARVRAVLDFLRNRILEDKRFLSGAVSEPAITN